MNEQVQSELKNFFNDRFSTSLSTRTNYARGEDTFDPVLSKAVVFPETNAEVSKILRISTDTGKGYRTLTNLDEHGGQEVPHLHFHLFGGEKIGKMVE